MNIFADKEVASRYDAYYSEEQGAAIDRIEKEAISGLLSSMEPGRMLEIGCGTGHWTEFFVKSGFSVLATDVSEPMMQLAIEKNISGAEFMMASVLQLPFADASFDQVAVITALEFCGDMDRAFSEICRVLKPGGWLVAGCLNADSVVGKNKNLDPVFKHGYFMTRDELEQRLKTIGDTPEIKECVFFSPDFEMIDEQAGEQTTSGVFMAAFVQKK